MSTFVATLGKLLACIVLCLCCALSAAQAASGEDIGIMLYATTNTAKGFDPSIKTFIEGKYVLIDDQSFRKRQSQIDEFLRRAAYNNRGTTLFRKAEREHYVLMPAKDYSPENRRYYRAVEIVALRYRTEQECARIKQIIESGMSNKGPMYTFIPYYGRKTVYIILYEGTRKAHDPLLLAATDIIENCLLPQQTAP